MISRIIIINKYISYTLPIPPPPHHLDLTKQIGKSLSLDSYCLDYYVSAGNKLFNPNWCSEQLLIS